MIKEALNNNRYVFAMQPIFSREGFIEKYESLVRLEVDESKYLKPSDFFKLAEKGNYFANILISSLLNAINFLKIHPDKKVTINISYKDIAEKKTVKLFFELLEKQEDKTKECLIVEFIESYDIKNIDQVVNFCRRLKDNDVKISIDDFGIKNSNFYILSMIKIDYLKIDGHFIKNIDKNKTFLIVQTIIDICKKLNIEVIAEHIENELNYSTLKDMGVDYFQGYYLGKPSIKNSD